MRDRPSRPKSGLRRVRAICLTALAGFAVSAVAASAAHAVPLGSLNYGYATITGTTPLPDGTNLLDGTQSATLEGDVDGGGNITNGNVTFPAKTFPLSALNPAAPAGSTLTIAFNEAAPLTGTTNPVTGQLAITGTYDTDVTVAGFPGFSGTCQYTLSDSTTPGNAFTLTTESAGTGDTYEGRRFNNPAGGANSPGSIAGDGTLRQDAGQGGNPTCGLLAGNLDNAVINLWLGRNSIPEDGGQFVQTYEYGRLNVGIATDLNLITPDAPAQYIGLITGTSSGAVTDPTQSTASIQVPGGDDPAPGTGGFHFTEITGSLSGISLMVDVDLLAPGMTGAFNAATGTMSLGDTALGQIGNYKATVTLPSGPCTSQPIPLELNTSKNNGSVFDPDPLFGQAYTGGLGGAGAVADQWTDLPDAPEGGNCNTLNAVAFNQQGGLWMSHLIVPPSPPQPPPTTTTPVPNLTPVAPAKKCKKGQKLKKGKCVKKKKKKKKK